MTTQIESETEQDEGMSEETYRVIAHWNKEHKHLLESSKNAGCYFCCTIYPASEIKEWIKSYRKRSTENDCALCPRCGIDSVLPDCRVVLSVPLLRQMYEIGFGEETSRKL